MEQIRGHSFVRPVVHETLRRTGLRAHLLKQMERDSAGKLDDYIRVLRSLQLIGGEGDPISSLLDLYESQVLAFYDPATHVYYSLDTMPAGMDALVSLSTPIEVHELTHALQDQVFDVGRKLDERRVRWDAEMAYHAVVEGEATLVTMASMFSGMGRSIDDVVKDSAVADALVNTTDAAQGISVEIPRYFVETMKFPYAQGFRFVIAAYRRGGWSAIDRLHQIPPESTSEILHPEIYFQRVASLGNKIFPPVKQIRTNRSSNEMTTVLGEFHWRFLLGSVAADGWLTDSATVHVGGKDRGRVAIRSSWRSEKDAGEFAKAYRDFLAKKSLVARVHQKGKTVRVDYNDASSLGSLSGR